MAADMMKPDRPGYKKTITGCGLSWGFLMHWIIRFAVLGLLLGAPLVVGAAEAASEAEAHPGGDYVGADICSECHEDKFDQILPSKHAQMNDLRTPFAHQGCETCHGRGETHALSEGEDLAGLIVYGKDSSVSVSDQNDNCLRCHQTTERMHWQGSAHESADLVCSSCHLIHQPDGILNKERVSDVCTTCHWQVRADLHKASAHPVRQGLVTCTDCHIPHGSAGPAQLKTFTVNQTCFKCHAEKRGPFLWEHEPVTEDCTVCHTPHGSNNPALLVRRTPLLCQECHQVTGGIGAHANRELEWGSSMNDRVLFGANCLNCHSQVHGSNHPSGAVLQR
jgi:DmsE family decaheme c-type cytochrome